MPKLNMKWGVSACWRGHIAPSSRSCSSYWHHDNCSGRCSRFQATHLPQHMLFWSRRQACWNETPARGCWHRWQRAVDWNSNDECCHAALVGAQPLNSWKETLATLATYATNDTWQGLAQGLAERLFSNHRSASLRHVELGTRFWRVISTVLEPRLAFAALIASCFMLWP